MADKDKLKLCVVCGKKSIDVICDSCKDKLQAEAFYKKKKDEKEKK